MSAIRRLILLLCILLPSISSGQDTTFGWIGPLTGNSAVVGQDSLAAIQLAVQQTNNKGGIYVKQIRLVAEDDGYDTQRSLNAYSKMVADDKPSVVFMQTYGALFALGDRPVKDGVIVFDVLDCNEAIAALPGNTFCLATLTESVAEGFVDDITARGLKSSLILYEENDPWMAFIEKTSTARLTDRGVAVISEASLASASDYRSILARAKSKNVESVIFLGNDQMGLALKQARDIGIKAQFYSIGSMTSPGFQALSGAASEGTLVSFWESAESGLYQSFLADFRNMHHREPILQLAAAPAYDAAEIAIGAVASRAMASTGKGAINADDLRAELLRTRNLGGVCGVINIDPDGAVRSIREKLYIYRQGKLERYNGPKEQTVKIGVIVPLTGDMAFAGAEVRNGMLLAASELKDTKRNYELLFEDNALDLKRSVSAARKLLDVDKVDVVITLWPPTANVVAPLTEDRGVLHYTIVWDPSIAAQHKYVLSHQAMVDTFVAATLDLLKKQGVRKLAFFQLNETGFNMGTEIVRSKAPAYGIEISDFVLFNAGQTDFRTEITRMRSKNPDGVLLWAVMPEMGILLKQLKDQGFSGVVTGFFDIVQDLKTIEGRPFVSEVHGTDAFADKYRKAYGSPFILKAPNAYDIMKLIAVAYEKSPEAKPSAAALKANLVGLHDFNGAVGKVSIDSSGNSSYPASFKKVEGGELKEIGLDQVSR